MSNLRDSLFIVPGMPRSGTTFLYHNLQRHPGLYFAFRKESNYFCVNHGKGFGWFERLFADRAPHQRCGDISPYYWLDEASVARIEAFNPEAPVVAGVRRPSEVALSLYTQTMTQAYGVPPFARFIEEYTFDVAGRPLPVRLRDGILTRMLDRYREALGARMLLFEYDFFKCDRLAVLRAIEQFLGLPAHFTPDNFDDVLINAGNRRGFKPLTVALRNEWLIKALERTLPHAAIRRMRGRMDASSASEASAPPPPGTRTPENEALAREAFAEEDARVEALFAGGGLLHGNGEAFAQAETGETAS